MPVGPTGVEITDSFTFVHQPLTGDGRLTARLAALDGRIPSFNGDMATDRAGLVPWAKAGLIIKAGTSPGSAYAAVMLTGGHGTRMQTNFTGDTAGTPGAGAATPRWLRLTRTGDTITGEESPDGSRWTTIGTVTMADLPSTVEIGLFATSPQYAESGRGRVRRRPARPADRARRRARSTSSTGQARGRPTWSAGAPTARGPGTRSLRLAGSP